MLQILGYILLIGIAIAVLKFASDTLWHCRLFLCWCRYWGAHHSRCHGVRHSMDYHQVGILHRSAFQRERTFYESEGLRPRRHGHL